MALVGSKGPQTNVRETFTVIDYTTNVTTGDGKYYYRVPDTLDGANLSYVVFAVITAGTTGSTDIQIHNVTQAADMLSTVVIVETGETDSSTGAAAVIDVANDDVAEGDILRIDIDAVSTTPPQGVVMTLGFTL